MEGEQEQEDITGKLLLNDGWVRQQIKCYTEWCNFHLDKVQTEVKAIDQDFRDGFALLKLLQVLSRERLRPRDTGGMRFHKINRVNQALDFITEKGVKLAGTKAVEIVDGDLKMTLGLIWVIILRFHIHGIDEEQVTSKEDLLKWCKTKTESYDNVDVRNFHSSFKDGLAFCALIHSHRPDLIPEYSSLEKDKAMHNLNLAFETARTHLHIPKMLDAQDTATDPYECAIMTYVCAYYNHFERPGQMTSPSWQTEMVDECEDQEVEKSKRAAKDLLKWIKQMLPWLSDRTPETTLQALQERQEEFDHYKSTLKPPKAKEKEQLKQHETPKKSFFQFWSSQTPVEDSLTSEVNEEWKKMEEAEKGYEKFLDSERRRLQEQVVEVKMVSTLESAPAPSVRAVGPGVEGGQVGKDAIFSLLDEIPDQMEIEITDPTGEPVEYSQHYSEGKPSFIYTSTMPGTYTVSFLISDKQIAEYKPAHKPPGHTEKCRVSGGGAEHARISVPAEFVVDCSEAGEGTLDIEIKSPFGETLDHTTESQGGGHYRVQFTPEKVGDYTIKITWSDTPIPNSPCTCRVCDPDQCEATGSGLTAGAVGHPASFQVATTEAGPGNLSVKIESPLGDVVENTISTDRKGSGIYPVEFIPKVVGEHKVSVYWSGFNILHSPFYCQVCDPRKCEASGGGLSGGTLRQPASFQVATKDAGQGNLSVLFTKSPKPVECALLSTVDGVHVYKYTPQEMGDYQLDIEFNGYPIPGSPFAPSPSKGTLPGNVYVRERPAGRLRANKPVKLTVDATTAGEDILAASVRGPSLQEDCQITSVEDGIYKVTFVPHDVGKHEVEITYGGSKIQDSPLNFTINDPSKCQVDVAALSSKSHPVNKPITFPVSTLLAGEGVLKSTGRGPDSDFTCTITEEGDGKYLVSFTPTECGKCFVDLFFDGHSFLESPIPIQVEDESLKVLTFDPVIPFQAGNPIELLFDTSQAGEGTITANVVSSSDEPVTSDISEISSNLHRLSFTPQKNDTFTANVFWNDKPVNDPLLTITFEEQTEAPPVSVIYDTENGLKGRLTASAIGQSTGEVDVDIRQFERGKYQMSFNPPQKDVYDLHVFWFGNEIKASPPFQIDTTSPPPKPKKEVLSKQTIPIELRDKQGVLSACAVGYTSGPIPTQDLQMTLTKLKDLVKITFKDHVRDTYNLFIFWNHQLLKGAPFVLDVSK